MPGQKKFEGVKDFAFFQVPPRSIEQQLAHEPNYFGYVSESKKLRALVEPVTFEMAIPINKSRQAVPVANSNNLPLDAQREIDENFGRSLASEGLKSIMVHAYALTHADIDNQKQANEKLIVGFYARTPDITVESVVAGVGRFDPDDRLNVNDWNRDAGNHNVWALPAVVPMDLKIG